MNYYFYKSLKTLFTMIKNSFRRYFTPHSGFSVLFLMSMLMIFAISSLAQEASKKLTLEDVIAIARQQSPDALAAKHRFRASYWQYRTYVANYRPKLNLNATIPNFNRAIQSIQMDDGSFTFQSSEYASSEVSLALSQKVGWTGGEVFLSSNLERLDLFQGDSTVTSYLTTPINIGFNQPLFGFNAYKWDKKIEPQKYKEAKQYYLESMEQVSLRATSLFFDVLLAQMQHHINQINLANNDTLYKIARGRYNIGTIAENELLQSAVEQSKLTLEDKIFQLKSFLRLPEAQALELITPQHTPLFRVSPATAIAEALENRSDALAFDRRLWEARQDVDEARKTNRFSVNVYALYGISQSAGNLSDAFKNPSERQQVSLGIQVPILDWGLAKGQIRMAESNEELVKNQVEQDRIDFRQEVYLQVAQFNMQENQLRIAAKSDTVAQKRYEVTKQRYMIGKISITELNIAQEEKDNARMGHINDLYQYWRDYYLLRKLTLFDFENQQEIEVDPELLLE
jgi:outer membrane protein TolC